ncbi:MAG: glycosyltransferase family 2 protein [Gammaproteobacteria bacterium]|nr:glycosyltransferase family 2 protein [Gammaproteobacteria bacterium]
MSRETPFLSCIIPAYNEAENIPYFIPALAKSLTELNIRYEIIVIDDGSKDNTLAALQPFLDQYPLKVFELSRNFGKEAAISAGLDQVSGNVTLLIDADFQHPISAVATMLDLWRSGYDMVYGIRDRKTESGIKQFLTRQFYWLMNAASSIDIPADAGDFRLMDQRVVKALQELPERTLYMKGMYAWVGFRSIGIHFTEAERHAGESNFNWKRLTGLALTGLTAFSDLPLRICVFLGAFIAFMALAYGTYITCDALIDGTTVPGWTTLAAGMMLLGGIQLLFIGVLGEYIARIYNETKGRPKYIIARQYDEANPAKPYEMNMIERASQRSSNTSQVILRDD